MSILSFVVGMVSDLGMCMQPTLRDTLALYVMMDGDMMKLVLCAGTWEYILYSRQTKSSF